MQAMILAAGRGERMGALTETTPKPLLCVGGKPLILWQIERLARAGFREIVVNLAYLGEQIEAFLGDGYPWGVRVRYSREPAGALETAGGIAHALPLLGREPFLVLNSDIWCDWDLTRARRIAEAAYPAWLVMTDNPPHHPQGDFCLAGERLQSVSVAPVRTLTYTGIGVFSPDFFAKVPPMTAMRLRPLLETGIRQGTVFGEYHGGRWQDIGTPERLAALDRQVSEAAL